MTISFFLVDVFADRPLQGNPLPVAERTELMTHRIDDASNP
jgi:predicted PhzF superfamily epimerase YddE/YHI9